jgi:hypothetical protein
MTQDIERLNSKVSNEESNMVNDTSTDRLNRRQFLRGAGTVALTLGFGALNGDGARADSMETPKLINGLKGESTVGTYYVDNSGSDGVGSRDDPWNNIAGHINSLSAGDTMFVRGDSPGTRTYNEAQIRITVNGSAGNPITLQAFPGENVRLQSSATGDDQIQVSGDYITISGFEIDRDSRPERIIHITGDHVTIDSCTLHNAKRSGVVVRASYITIQDCTIHDIVRPDGLDAAGVGIYGTLTGTTIRGCTMYDITGDCVVVDDTEGNVATGTTIEDCHLYVHAIDPKTAENAIDIKDGSVVIRNCTMHGFRAGKAAIGAAVLVHNRSTSSLVEGCLIYDCTSGIRWNNGASDNTMRRTVIRDLVAADSESWLESALYILGAATKVSIYNCTFSNCPARLARADSGATLVFRNNICTKTGDITERDRPVVVADYNCWNRAAQSWAGTNDVNADPAFRDEAARDLRLTALSPCRNAGTDVGLAYSESAPDLGAFEFIEGEPSPKAPELEAPLDGTVTRSAIVEFRWSDVGAATYNLRVDGTVYATGATSMTQELSNGAHSWAVQAAYASGETSVYSDSWTVTVDTTPVPVPYLDRPADGTVTDSASVEFRWSDVGAAAYQLRVDEDVYTTEATSLTLILSNGSHTWTVQALDSAGSASGYTDPWTVTVDTTLAQSLIEFVIRDETSGEETAFPLKLDHTYTLKISNKP